MRSRSIEGVNIATLDLSLPDGNAADLIPELHAASPHATAIVLSSSIAPGEAAEALHRGAAAVPNSSITPTSSSRRSNASSDAQLSDPDALAFSLALVAGRVDTGCMRRLRVVPVGRVG